MKKEFEVDDKGIPIKFDDQGNPMTLVDGEWVPKPVRKVRSGFTFYEGKGCCSFCGSFTCSGSCFK